MCLDNVYPQCSLALIAVRDVLKCSLVVIYFGLVFACKKETFCFTTKYFINHSSAWYFEADTLNSKYGGKKMRVSHLIEVELAFCPSQPLNHLHWNLKIEPLNIFHLRKNRLVLRGMPLKKKEVRGGMKEAKQTKDVAHKTHIIFRVSTHKEVLS